MVHPPYNGPKKEYDPNKTLHLTGAAELVAHEVKAAEGGPGR